MAGLKILGCGLDKGEKVVTNADFEKILETSDEWIASRTGIRERRFVSESQTNVSLATAAAKQAIEKSGIDVADIAVCIVATFTPDVATPSVSCVVGKQLGLNEDTTCFDLNSACTGFVYASNVAYSMLAANPDKYALVIGSEKISKKLDMTDRGTAILFGDGAGATVLKREEDLPYAFTAGFVADVDESLYCRDADDKIVMDGKAVFRFATSKMSKAISDIFSKYNLTSDDIDVIIPHQANRRIIDHVAKKLGLDTQKIFVNLDKIGNTSAASIPLALCEAGVERGKRVLCVGFGAGLTYGAILLNS